MFSYMFSPTASFLFLTFTLIYFLRFWIRRAAQNSGRMSISAQPVKKKDYPYKLENTIQTYGLKKRNSKAAEERKYELWQVFMGNFIDTFRVETVAYLNTITNLHGTVCELSMVFDYDAFEQGEAIEEKIPFRFNLADISRINVYGEFPTYMIIYLRARGGSRKMIFEFEGMYGKKRAQEAAADINRLKILYDSGGLK